MDPGWSVPCRLVELLHTVTVVAEVRPAHAFQIPALDQILNVDLLPRAGTRQGHNKNSRSPREAFQVAYAPGSHRSCSYLVVHGLTPPTRQRGSQLRDSTGYTGSHGRNL